MIRKFFKNEKGATAIEYGLIAAIIAVGIISVLSGVKEELKATFETVETKLNEANTQ